jgi:hypothetical protein
MAIARNSYTTRERIQMLASEDTSTGGVQDMVSMYPHSVGTTTEVY